MKKALATMMVVLAIGAVASAATLTIDIVPSATTVDPGQDFTVGVYATVTDSSFGISSFSANVVSATSTGVVNAKEKLGFGGSHTGDVATTWSVSPSFTSINPKWMDKDADGDMDAIGVAGAWTVADGPWDVGTTRTLLATETWTATAAGVAALSVVVDPACLVFDDAVDEFERPFDVVQGVGASVTVTPEPATLGLLALGLLGLLRRR